MRTSGRTSAPREAAEAASRLEIELVGEPIGKQDQYAAAFGGFNVLRFNADGTVDVEPVLLDYKRRLELEQHMLVFFTGVTRFASSVSSEQKTNITRRSRRSRTWRRWCPTSKTASIEGDFRRSARCCTKAGCARRGWPRACRTRRSTASTRPPCVPAPGAARFSGAGGGGCLLFVAPPGHKERDTQGRLETSRGPRTSRISRRFPCASSSRGGSHVSARRYRSGGVMKSYIQNFSNRTEQAIRALPHEEIGRALNILQAVYERDGRVYVFGNGGSLALATHWVADFNKTVFSHNLGHSRARFQTIRVPTTEEELTAWANDVGYDYVFAGPLKNYLQDSDVVIAISSSGTR